MIKVLDAIVNIVFWVLVIAVLSFGVMAGAAFIMALP